MVIALDYGEKKTGFAHSDETESFAFSGRLLSGYKDVSGLILLIDEAIQQYSPKVVVIGDPSYKGPNKNMENINKIAEYLKEKNIEVRMINEFYTSEIAKVNLKEVKNKNIDSESARQILQEYLDNLKH